MTHSIFSESECFRRKIMTQSNRFKLTKTKPPSAKTEVICLPSKERKKKKGFSFGFWLILVKHVEFGAGLSNPRWFVCERYLLTSLLSYNWLSIKPAYSFQQCMAKQFALSTRSFDKFQEKEAFSGILPEGISQNIILRVFVKHQETFFFRFFFKFVVNADGFSQNTRLNSFHG